MWLFEIKKKYLALLFVLPFFLLGGLIPSIGKWFDLISVLFISFNLFKACKQICIELNLNKNIIVLNWSVYLTLMLIFLYLINAYFQIIPEEDQFSNIVLDFLFTLGFIGCLVFIIMIARLINYRKNPDVFTYFKYFFFVVMSPLFILFIKDDFIKNGWIKK